MRRYHDIGGQPAGPVDTSDHPTEPWAKTAHGHCGRRTGFPVATESMVKIITGCEF
jgi:hypothetical protein